MDTTFKNKRRVAPVLYVPFASAVLVLGSEVAGDWSLRQESLVEDIFTGMSNNGMSSLVLRLRR